MNELEALAEKERQEKQQREEQQQALRQQMVGLEQQSITTDEVQRTAYKERAIQYERNYEASLVQDMSAEAKSVKVKKGPPDDGRPLEAPAADESWKDRRDRVKREKKATADINQYLTSASLCITPELQETARKRGIDIRVVSNFSEPFELDRHGRPATPDDEVILRRNQAFARDYVLGNELERKERFNEIISKVLGMEITPHMLDNQQYVMENAQKLEMMGTQLTSMEAVLSANKAFYDALAPEIREKVEDKMNLMGEFGIALSQAFRVGGINSSNGAYWGDTENAETMREEARSDFSEMNGMFRERCTAYQLEQERKNIYSKSEKAEEKRFYQEKYGAYFANGATDYQYDELKRVRDCIVGNPERYEENKELLDHFYQEFYHALEAAGKAAVDVKSYMLLGGRHEKDADADSRDLYQLAEKLCEEKGRETELLAEYAANVEDVLLALLNGAKMPDAAQKLVANYYEEQRQARWTKYADEQKAQAEAERQAQADAQEKERLAAEKEAEEAEKLRFEKERIAGLEEAQKLNYEKERIAGAKNLISDREKQARKLQVWHDTAEEKQAHRESVAAWQRIQGKAPAAEPAAPVSSYEKETAQWKLPKGWQESAQNGVDYMKNIIKCKELSFPPEYKAHRADLKFDHRNPFFVKEFKLNEKGEPAGDEDRKIVEENLKNFRAYAAGDPAVRKPMLDELISKFRNINLRPDEFDDSTQLLKDMPYYFRIAQLQLDVTTAENNNPAYFEQMEPALKEEFRRKKEFFSSFGMNYLINYALSMNGLDLYHRTLCEDEDTIKTFVPSYYERLEKAHRQIPLYNTEKQADRIYKEKRADFAETDKSRRKHYGVSFPNGAGVEQYREMRDLRKMIAANPEAYAAQRELVDAMFKKLYAGNAMLGENEFRIHANQDIAEGRAEAPEDGVDEETRVRCASEAMEKLRQEQSNLKGYGTGIRELLSSLLEGKAMTEAAAMVLAAYNAELRRPDLERAAREQKDAEERK